ncbi:MAG: hypothetical protein V4773_22665 [Verrucomicrobiota bacterium]
MKLILHIVRKDLRRLRGWIAAWLALLILPIGLGVTITRVTGASDEWGKIEMLHGGLIILQVAVAYLMVLLLVLDDPVAGTRQFWTTRPIGGRRLLAAKALGAAAILWGGMMLVGIPWWWWCGWGVTEMARAALDYALLAVAVATPAVAMGAIVDSLPRALLWTPVLLVVLFIWGIPVVASSRGGDGPALFLFRTAIAITGTWGVVWLVLARLYRTRKYFPGVIGWGLGLAFVWLGCALLPVEAFFRDSLRPVRPERAAGLNVVFREATIETSRNSRPPQDQVRAAFEITGEIPSGLYVQGQGLHESWSWGGTPIERHGALGAGRRGDWLLGYAPPKPDAETEAWTAKMQEAAKARRPDLAVKSRAVRRPMERADLWTYTFVPASVGARMDKESPTYHATVWLSLFRPTVRSEVPLKSGSTQRGNDHRVILNSVSGAVGMVESERFGQRVRVAETRNFHMTDFVPHRWREELYERTASQTWWRRTSNRGGYVILKKDTKEIIGVSNERPSFIHVHGVKISTQKARIYMDLVWRGQAGALVERPGLMENTVLAYVDAAVESVFMREVKVDEFKVRRLVD